MLLHHISYNDQHYQINILQQQYFEISEKIITSAVFNTETYSTPNSKSQNVLLENTISWTGNVPQSGYSDFYTTQIISNIDFDLRYKKGPCKGDAECNTHTPFNSEIASNSGNLILNIVMLLSYDHTCFSEMHSFIYSFIYSITYFLISLPTYMLMHYDR